MRYIDFMDSKIMKGTFDEAKRNNESWCFVFYEDVTKEEITEFKKDLYYLKNNLKVADVDLIIEFKFDCIVFFEEFYTIMSKEISDRELINQRIYEDLENLQTRGFELQVEIGRTIEKYCLEELIHFYLDRVAKGEEQAIYYFVVKMIMEYVLKKKGEEC